VGYKRVQDPQGGRGERVKKTHRKTLEGDGGTVKKDVGGGCKAARLLPNYRVRGPFRNEETSWEEPGRKTTPQPPQKQKKKKKRRTCPICAGGEGGTRMTKNVTAKPKANGTKSEKKSQSGKP